MLKLNLLSQEQKKEIKKNKLNNLVKQIITVLFAAVLIFSIFMGITKKILTDNLAELRETNRSIEHEFNNKINKVNELADFISEIKNENYQWSELLIDLAKKSSVNIELSSLQADSAEKKITVAGLAVTRDSLLNFKNNLEKSIYLENIELPIQNLTQKENITFSISAKIKLDNLTQ